MHYWLVKSEESDYSIDDFEKDGVCRWTGVRNYQARNFLQEMMVGDKVFFYHSNAEPSGIVGLGQVTKQATPDETQFEKKSPYFDEKASKDNPRWFCPDMSFVEKFSKTLSLDDLRGENDLRKMVILQKGSRLSVTPITPTEFKRVMALTKLR